MTSFLDVGLGVLLLAGSASMGPEEDREIVSRLDLAFQEAVKANDAETIDKILHPEFWLVRGDGTVITRETIVNEAKSRSMHYTVQDEEPGTQTVRVWKDTAVVTALLNIEGTSSGKVVKTRLWFSDTYVRTDQGWRYAFAQVSLPLPEKPGD